MRIRDRCMSERVVKTVRPSSVLLPPPPPCAVSVSALQLGRPSPVDNVIHEQRVNISFVLYIMNTRQSMIACLHVI